MLLDPSESFKHYASRIKGQAACCDYTVKCTASGCNTIIAYAEEEIRDQICKGIADPDVQRDIMTQRRPDLPLDELVNLIAAKESGKKSHSAVFKNYAVSKISPYRKNKSTSHHKVNEICTCCGKSGHGTRAELDVRKTQCPAYGKQCSKYPVRGHFAAACRRNTIIEFADINLSDGEDLENMDILFLGNVQAINNDNLQSSIVGTLIPHLEHQKDGWWTVKKP